MVVIQVEGFIPHPRQPKLRLKALNCLLIHVLDVFDEFDEFV